MALKQILTEGGYPNILEAVDGLTALDQLKAHSDIDLVLTDNNMPPGMSGLRLLEVMKKNPDLTHIPVIMISANDDPRFIESVRKLGVAAFVSKPVMDTVLIALVAEQLDNKHS